MDESWIRLLAPSVLSFVAVIVGQLWLDRRRGDPFAVALRERQIDACQTVLTKALEVSYAYKGSIVETSASVNEHYLTLCELIDRHCAILPSKVIDAASGVRDALVKATDDMAKLDPIRLDDSRGKPECIASIQRSIARQQFIMTGRTRRALKTDRGTLLANRIIDPFHWQDVVIDWLERRAIDTAYTKRNKEKPRPSLE